MSFSINPQHTCKSAEKSLSLLKKKTMKKENFRFRTYGKTELALCYNPNMSGQGARKKLMQWIHLHPTLPSDLTDAGFCETAHTFTPIQVRLIVDALGEP